MLDPGRMLVLAACAACAVCAGPLAAAPAAALPVEDYRWPGDTLLTQYVTEALLRHPDLSRRDAMVLEADAGKARASAWTNPVLSFGVMDAPTDFRLSEDPMTQKQLGIAQTLPWFTKPVYSRRAAAGRSEAARSYADAERWALRARVAAGYFRLAGLRARAFYLWEALAIADETVSATAAAVASGMDSRAVLLKAEVGRGRISGEISTLRGETEKARWELAAAVGRSEVVSLTDPRPLPAFLPAVNWTALDLEHSPAIRALRSDSVSAYWEWRRARLEYFPDFMLGFKYGFRSGSYDAALGPDAMSDEGSDDTISLELSAPVPLWGWGNQRAGVGESRAVLDKAAAELSGGRLSALSGARGLEAEVAALASQYSLVSDTLLVLAEEALKAELSEYEAGRSNRAAVNEMRMNLTELRAQRALLAAEYLARKAELEALVGRIL